jgi:hypothetical protein
MMDAQNKAVHGWQTFNIVVAIEPLTTCALLLFCASIITPALPLQNGSTAEIYTFM